jgi:hypothetical protein
MEQTIHSKPRDTTQLKVESVWQVVQKHEERPLKLPETAWSPQAFSLSRGGGGRKRGITAQASSCERGRLRNRVSTRGGKKERTLGQGFFMRKREGGTEEQGFFIKEKGGT